MIKFLINISSAIKHGILRFFPLPLQPCLYALAILTLLTVYSCATPRHTTSPAPSSGFSVESYSFNS